MQYNGFRLTNEQENALEIGRKLVSGQILKMEAGAGCAKTFTLCALTESVFTQSKVLYLAFNRKIVAEISSKQIKGLDCFTWHGLAMQLVGKRFTKQQLETPFTAKIIAEALNFKASVLGFNNIQFCELVRMTIANYCNSEQLNIEINHVEIPHYFNRRLSVDQQQSLKAKVFNCARSLWVQMTTTDRLPIDFDVVFKLFANEMISGHLTLDYQVVLLDEAQDTSDLCLAVLKVMQSKLVLVGDRHQSLYQWRKAVNAMAKVESDFDANLYQTFRYGQELCDLAGDFLAKHKRFKGEFIGNPRLETEIITEQSGEPKGVLLSRTNTNVVKNVLQAVESGRDCFIVGGSDKLLELVASVDQLRNNMMPKSREIAQFDSWIELKDYSLTEQGLNYRSLVRHIEKWGAERLINGLSKLTDKPNNDLIGFGNVHQSKGFEYPHVALDNDFMALKGSNVDEEANTYYVAMTRAKYSLDVSRCSAVRELV
ncbi:UvrD-helicase domain-containing protein [Photobacterium leiognathi]|uniref:UvrD-helicase domain-containing protein n=1 Tax=Photobacterium leiognathi TaxID=553611 RepID=UPI00298197E8|nr:UvrD-helicase domain-containing protein [Photobacterium leiognathi]